MKIRTVKQDVVEKLTNKLLSSDNLFASLNTCSTCLRLSYSSKEVILYSLHILCTFGIILRSKQI